MPFLISLIPDWLLHVANFIRYGLLYRSLYISPKSYILGTELGTNVLIGGGFYIKNCRIGRYTNLSGTEGGGIHSHIENTTIGKFCSIGKNVQVLAHGHHTEYISTFPFYSNIQSFMFDRKKSHIDIRTKDTAIGNDVWIGTNVTIIGGVKIGDGAVIGAGSIVTKDVAPYAIVAGNPAKLIKHRFDENTIRKLLKYKWWNWSPERIRNSVSTLLQTDPKEFIDEAASEVRS